MLHTFTFISFPETAPRRQSDHEELLIMKDKFGAVLRICRHRSRLPSNFFLTSSTGSESITEKFSATERLDELPLIWRSDRWSRRQPATDAVVGRSRILGLSLVSAASGHELLQPLFINFNGDNSTSTEKCVDQPWAHKSGAFDRTGSEERKKTGPACPENNSSTKLKSSVRGDELCDLSPFLPAEDLASTKVVDHRKY